MNEITQLHALYMDDENIYYLGEHIQDTLKMVISRYPKSVLTPSSRKNNKPDEGSQNEEIQYKTKVLLGIED